MDLLDRLAPYRPVLYAVAAVGFFGLNVPFLVCAVARPDLVAAALANPVALVFILEAFVIVGLGAWGITRLGLERPGWAAFVALSMVGGLAFAVPAFTLWHLRGRRAGPEPRLSA